MPPAKARHPANVAAPATPDEFTLIRRYFSALGQGDAVLLGPGDDAALLALGDAESLVVSTDAQHADIHFPAQADAAQVAYRAVAAAASDLAAMGARPLGMTLALSFPAVDEHWLKGCSAGLCEAARDYGLPLVGGDTTRGALALTITVLGAVETGTALRRIGARPGDRLCVSHSLGDAAAGLALEQGRLQADKAAAAWLRERFWRPASTFELGQALISVASSAIDVSDGLLADAGHIAAASGVRLQIESDRVPLSAALLEAAGAEQALEWALTGGDDYALCFTLPPGAELPDECYIIGSAAEGAGVHCDGALFGASGFRHFE